MQQIILFGRPGAGKSFTGRLFESYYRYTYIDGDEYLPSDMRRYLKENKHVSEEMRNLFMESIKQAYAVIIKKNRKVVLSQTFLKDRHRKLFHSTFPKSQFVFVDAPQSVRRQRFSTQNMYHFTDAYWNAMELNFEKISVPYKKIENINDGTDYLKVQIDQLLNKN